MRYRTLGDSGLLVSVVGLGCNNFGGRLDVQPGCASVIAGATSAEQVTANVAAGQWRPTDDQLAAIDKLVPPPAARRAKITCRPRHRPTATCQLRQRH